MNDVAPLNNYYITVLKYRPSLITLTEFDLFKKSQTKETIKLNGVIASYIKDSSSSKMLVIKDKIFNTAQNIYLMSPIHIIQFRNKNVYYILVFK
jgi:hypothetical protein